MIRPLLPICPAPRIRLFTLVIDPLFELRRIGWPLLTTCVNVKVPPPVRVTAPFKVSRVLPLFENTTISPALEIVPETFNSWPVAIVRLLPGSMVNPPTATLVFRVTAETGDLALLMQTCAPPLGTTPVLQFAATLQFPEAPPIQMESPGAQPEAPAGENFAVTA